MGGWVDNFKMFWEYHGSDPEADTSTASFPGSVQAYYGLKDDIGSLKSDAFIGDWPAYAIAKLIEDE